MKSDPRIVCVDVDYRDPGAVAAGLWFHGWTAAEARHQSVVNLGTVAAYEPGAFYKRELPCLLSVLDSGPAVDVVIVDGYVWLGPDQPGLGKHLFDALQAPAVVGVAKRRFHGATTAIPIYRNASRAPLYITTEGLAIPDAVAGIERMHGPYRMPTLLRAVDRLCRKSSFHEKEGP